MKTMIKIAALAVITALIALACAPDAELTSRDWSEYDSQRSPKITNNKNNSNDSLPSFPSTVLPLPPASSSDPAITDDKREVMIGFPADADFLKVSNDKLEGKLKEFLTIYTFTNPIPAGTAGTESYVFSEKKADVNYTFVRRTNAPSGGGTLGTNSRANITIRLDYLSAFTNPNNASADGKTSAVAMVAKIDGAKYKVGGKGLDRDNDGNAGEAVYDDYFSTINVGSAAPTYTPPGGGRTLTLTLGSVGSGTNGYVAATVSKTFQIASLSGGGIGDNTSGGNAFATAADSTYNKRRQAVLEALIPQIKIQKYNDATGKWDDTGAAIKYQNNPASTNPNEGSYGTLWTNFNVDDLSIYRVYADKLKGMKTSGLADFYGVEQKISVNNNSIAGASNSTLMGLREEKYISARAAYYDTDKHMLVDQNDFQSDPEVIGRNYDNSGKKATIELKLFGIVPTNKTDPVFVKEDAEMFKKYLRLAYRIDGGALGNNIHTPPGTWENETTVAEDADGSDVILKVNMASSFTVGEEIKVNDTSYWIVSIDVGATPHEITLSGNVTANEDDDVQKYQPGTPTGVNVILTSRADIAFVKIDDVQFEKIMDSNTPPKQVATKLIITVDKGVKASEGKNLHLVIAPGFEYTDNLLYFGSFAEIDTIIDGIKGWVVYDGFQF